MACIISIMKELGYSVDEKGICLSLTIWSEISRRNGKHRAFRDRMQYISELKDNTLLPLIKTAQEHKIALDKNKSTIALNSEEIMLLEMDAFFFNLCAYQDPWKIQEFLNLGGPTFVQDNTNKIEKLLYDTESMFPSSYFLGCSDKDSYYSIQHFLAELLLNKNKPLSFGVVFKSNSHAIHLFYDRKEFCWILTNHSFFGVYSSIAELLPDLVNSFTCNGVLNLSCDVYIDEKLSSDDLILKNLRDISNKSLYGLNSINQSDSSLCTPLILASRMGFLEIVTYLLKNEDIDINLSDDKGRSPLWLAAYLNNLEIVKCLLKHNSINVNQTSNDGTSPLVAAVMLGYVEIARELLDDKNIVANENNIPGLLFISITKGYFSMIELLVQRCANFLNYGFLITNNLVIENCVKNALLRDQIKKLIADKTLVNFTPLHAAVCCGNVEIVKLLLAKGATVSIDASYGVNTLDFAHAIQSKEIINLLYSYMFNNCVVRNTNRTSLFKQKEENGSDLSQRKQLISSTRNKIKNQKLLKRR